MVGWRCRDCCGASGGGGLGDWGSYGGIWDVGYSGKASELTRDTNTSCMAIPSTSAGSTALPGLFLEPAAVS
jgi:hypothetical protein